MSRRVGRSATCRGLMLLHAALVFACQGSATPVPQTAEVAIAEDQPGEPEVVEQRVATAFDMVEEDAPLVVLVDGSLLRQGELFKTLALLTAAVPGVAQSIDELTEKCGFDPIQNVTRIALSGGIGERSERLLAFETEQPHDAVLSCVRNVMDQAKLEESEVRGTPALVLDDTYLALQDGVFVGGPKRRVERALAKTSSGARLPPDVYLYVATSLGSALGVERAEFKLGEGAGRLHAELTADTNSAAAAGRLVEGAQRAREMIEARIQALELEETQRTFFEGLIRDVHVERQGARASATLDVDGHDAVSALVGMGAALAVYGVKRYIVRAKIAEARAHVAQISQRLREHAEGAGQGSLPKSAPLTPAKVPPGTKIRSDRSAWQHPSWRAIDYFIEREHYFAYEFVTAKDRKSAVVRAHGDLNGDGNITLIESTVTVQKDGTVQVTPPGAVGDPQPLPLLTKP